MSVSVACAALLRNAASPQPATQPAADPNVPKAEDGQGRLRMDQSIPSSGADDADVVAHLGTPPTAPSFGLLELATNLSLRSRILWQQSNPTRDDRSVSGADILRLSFDVLRPGAQPRMPCCQYPQ